MINNKTIISVIIPTYNRCDSLKKTLDSLLTQNCDTDFDYEIIVVDNNSSDKTKETVESYTQKLNGRLIYLFESKQGRTFALNKGIKETRGEIVSFTDDDCIPDQTWLKNIHQAFKDKRVDLVGGRVLPFFPVQLPKWLNNYKENIFKYPLMYYDLGEKYLENSNGIKILPIGANTAVRKTSFYRYGKFKHVGRTQDIEFAYRWQRLGANIVYSPDIIVHHYTYPNRLRKNYFRKYYFQTGKDHAEIYKSKYNRGRLFFGVPLWLYRKLIKITLKTLKNILLFDKNTFLNELKIYYNLGIICNLHGFKLSFEHLR